MNRLAAILLLLAAAAPALRAAADAEYGVDVPGRLIYVSVARGHDPGPGTRDQPYRTISQAAAVAMPGDAVLVDVGIYRERVAPPRGGTASMPILYRAKPGHQVVISGANRWSPAWTSLRAGSPVVWAVPDPALFTDDCYWTPANPFRVAMARTPGGRDGRPEYLRGVAGADPSLVLTLGQVFVDGVPLLQLGSLAELEAAPAGWWYEAESGRLHVRFPDGIGPAGHGVEITTRRRVFAPHLRGLGYIQVIGFVIERCGNQFPARFWESRDTVQAGALGTRAGHHWAIRDNVVRQANGIGMDIGGEGEEDGERLAQPRPASAVIGDHLVEANWVVDNGVSGIAGSQANRVVVRGNVVARNNALGFQGLERYEQAGIKLHAAHDARIEGNLVLDNRAYGIYLDSGGSYVGARITRNLLVGDAWGGVHLEQSNYPADSVLIDTNVVLDCGGTGVYLNGASGVSIVQNLFAGIRPADAKRGSGAYIHFAQSFGGLSDTGRVSFRGNLVIDDTIPLDLNYPTAFASSRALDANLYGTAGTARVFLVNPYANDPRLTDTVLIDDIHRDLGSFSPGKALLTAPARGQLIFDEWRRFWAVRSGEHESASRLDPTAIARRAPVPGFAVDLMAATDGMSVPRHPALTVDFAGRTLPTGALAPGPWQGLPAGSSRLACWSGIPVDPPVGGANTAPTISAISDRSVPWGRGTGALAFTVGDGQTAAGLLRVMALTSSPTLLPVSGIVFGGSGAARTISVTPGFGQMGQGVVTVIVSDGVLSAARTFSVTVRTPLASEVDLAVNFQPEAAPVPQGHLMDGGRIYGNRGNGFAYGWNVDARDATRDRNSPDSPDQRHDTLINVPAGAVWEIGLPNGTYDVRLVCGDPSFTSGTYRFLAEGVTIVDGSPTPDSRWLDATWAITVRDGRLTIAQGSGAQLGRLCFIEIRSTLIGTG